MITELVIVVITLQSPFCIHYASFPSTAPTHLLVQGYDEDHAEDACGNQKMVCADLSSGLWGKLEETRSSATRVLTSTPDMYGCARFRHLPNRATGPIVDEEGVGPVSGNNSGAANLPRFTFWVAVAMGEVTEGFY